MKAVRIDQHGGPEALQVVEVADPVAGPGESLMAELRTAQARVEELSAQLEEAQNEIAARMEKSKQFGNMRQMLAKKNAVIKGLRDQLKANGIAMAGDVDAQDD